MRWGGGLFIFFLDPDIQRMPPLAAGGKIALFGRGGYVYMMSPVEKQQQRNIDIDIDIGEGGKKRDGAGGLGGIKGDNNVFLFFRYLFLGGGGTVNYSISHQQVDFSFFLDDTYPFLIFSFRGYVVSVYSFDFAPPPVFS